MFARSIVRRGASRELAAVCFVIALVILLGFACSDDPQKPPTPVKTSNFQDLTERDHVLSNLIFAYNERNHTEMNELLDDNFIFYFSRYDVVRRYTQRLWDKSGEMAATGVIFDTDYNGPYRVLDTDVMLSYTEGDADWTAVPPRDDLKYAGETWYYKEASYRVKIVAEVLPDTITYYAAYFRAGFTVRQVDVGGKNVWRLVECRDDLDAAFTGGARAGETSASQEVTWGRIKQLFYSGSAYLDLTERDHVLENLQLCYNQRNFTEYSRLLDESKFVYYFSFADFMEGKTPELWGRLLDLSSAMNLFDLTYPGVYRAISIGLSLQYPADQWITIIPDQGQFPGETWYQKTVYYNLTVVAEAQPENITFIAQNLQALFTIRQSEVDGEQEWRIVEWRDDLESSTFTGWASASVQGSTWGSIKSLYHR